MLENEFKGALQSAVRRTARLRLRIPVDGDIDFLTRLFCGWNWSHTDRCHGLIHRRKVQRGLRAMSGIGKITGLAVGQLRRTVR